MNKKVLFATILVFSMVLFPLGYSNVDNDNQLFISAGLGSPSMDAEITYIKLTFNEHANGTGTNYVRHWAESMWDDVYTVDKDWFLVKVEFGARVGDAFASTTNQALSNSNCWVGMNNPESFSVLDVGQYPGTTTDFPWTTQSGSSIGGGYGYTVNYERVLDESDALSMDMVGTWEVFAILWIYNP